METKKELTIDEKKRLQLSKSEIESKQMMLFEEEMKLSSLEMQIITEEDALNHESGLKQLEMQLAQLKSQVKLIPFYEKQIQEKTPLKVARNMLKNRKKQIETVKSNIKVLRRQINTGSA